MRRVKTVIAALCLLAALAVGAQAQSSSTSTTDHSKMGHGTTAAGQKSLYERLGGLDAIKAVVGEFASRVLADERINKKFAKTDATRLTHCLVEQVCAATGGPCVYTCDSMKKSHKNMKVTEGEFNALVEDLVGALDKFNVPATEKNELLSALAAMKGDIVEVAGNATGTPLPRNFKPAKPLPKARTDAGPAKKKAGK
ncbi:MAG TPA: group 1 truncated hemoglobin [Pyrinomonadaceae bacterium]|nr:group 1 truncated hemoglobin [Pyrinomonadaceae bacterium]